MMIVVYPQFFFLPLIKDTNFVEDDCYRDLENNEDIYLQDIKKEKTINDILEEIDNEYVEKAVKKL